MINVDYPEILNLVKEYKEKERTESAAFLIWYLENYYRLDSQDAIDSVCDKRGDKGIDGIYLNEAEETIDVFQSRISQDPNATIGDVALKEFYGTLSQFDTVSSLENLVKTAGDAQVAGLINRLNLINKLGAYSIRGIFLCNIDLDSNGEAFLNTKPNIEFVGQNKLVSTYVSDDRSFPMGLKASFDISGISFSKYIVDENTIAIMVPIKASELVNLQGISDQSLFAFNVRGPLGRTQVNKDIVKSIKDKSLHNKFPLFHNGITIIANKIKCSNEKIEIETFFVVNGCQSLTTLYENRQNLTDELRLLTKFIQVGVDTNLSVTITQFSNNQNGVKSRDFKSNNPIQIRLQNEFNNIYKNEYFYEIKRGELSNDREVISNEMAGIYLWSFDIKEPWNTHRKYQVFEEKYTDLYSRPEVNADRILMLHLLDEKIKENVSKINNQLYGKYALTRYSILYMLRQIFENDNAGRELLKSPEKFVRNVNDRKHFKVCANNLISDIIVDLNGEIDPYGEDFDYKSKLREENWVKEISRNVVSSYLKISSRGRIKSFKEDWENR